MPADDPLAVAEARPDLIRTPLAAWPGPEPPRETGIGFTPGSRPRSAATTDRLAVARLLAERGPIPGEDAARALGWTTERWWDAAGRCKAWFRLTGTGWVLSGEGRREVDPGAAAAGPR